MKKEDIEKLEQTLDDQGATIGRFATENSSLRIVARKNYEGKRRLENAIRKHATKDCACKNPRECLLALGRLVPKLERPPYKRRLPAPKQ